VFAELPYSERGGTLQRIFAHGSGRVEVIGTASTFKWHRTSPSKYKGISSRILAIGRTRMRSVAPVASGHYRKILREFQKFRGRRWLVHGASARQLWRRPQLTRCGPAIATSPWPVLEARASISIYRRRNSRQTPAKCQRYLWSRMRQRRCSRIRSKRVSSIMETNRLFSGRAFTAV
jgi:hypothetical protein